MRLQNWAEPFPARKNVEKRFFISFDISEWAFLVSPVSWFSSRVPRIEFWLLWILV